MSLLLIKRDGEPISVRIDDHEFASEEEHGEIIIPKRFLVGFHLSEIPDGIVIKPVDDIEGNVIQLTHDMALSRFREGSASASVEEIFRRKFWDGDVGLTPYVLALRQAVAEQEQPSETDFQDDGDYVFLHYEITITRDPEIQDAIKVAETTIEQVRRRADQLVARRRDGLLGNGSMRLGSTIFRTTARPSFSWSCRTGKRGIQRYISERRMVRRPCDWERATVPSCLQTAGGWCQFLVMAYKPNSVCCRLGPGKRGPFRLTRCTTNASNGFPTAGAFYSPEMNLTNLSEPLCRTWAVETPSRSLRRE
jgi:hypothetical protein